MDKLTQLTDKELCEKRNELKGMGAEINNKEAPTGEDLEKMDEYRKQIEEIDAEKAKRDKIKENCQLFSSDTEQTTKKRAEGYGPTIIQRTNKEDGRINDVISAMQSQLEECMPPRSKLLQPSRYGNKTYYRAEGIDDREQLKKEAIDIIKTKELITRKMSACREYEPGLKFRAETYGTLEANSNVVPTTVSNEILAQVIELSPLISMCNMIRKNGRHDVILEDTTEDDIQVQKVRELEVPESHIMKFKKITLNGTTLRAKAGITRDDINELEIPFVRHVAKRMSEKFKYEFEWAMNHPEKLTMDDAGTFGFKGVTTSVAAKSNHEIVQTDLINLMEPLGDTYSERAAFLMNNATYFELLRQEDSIGHLKFAPNPITQKPMLFFMGYPIVKVAGIDTVAAGKDVIYFGDLSGLTIKVSRDLSIETDVNLDYDLFLTYGFFRFDARITEPYKFVKLTMKNE